jgi:D-alanine-D-alanine ligase
MANDYSEMWFQLLLQPIAPAQTAREIAFLKELLPLSTHRRVLDLCCGEGRHCAPLANAGYQVTGLDRNSDALCKARKRCASANFVLGDMRNLPFSSGAFDAVLCLWQSFGYFDDATNMGILGQLRRVLSPRGRLVLDVYHRDFFSLHQGIRSFITNGRTIRETQSLRGNRLSVELDYGAEDRQDRFEWQVYQPEELCQLAQAADFSLLHACANFDAGTPVSPAFPRMQLIFEAAPR